MNNKKDVCTVCGKSFSENDDVVYCPICGAPHHRECYNQTGKCALEQFHGTEQEYDPDKKASCENKDDQSVNDDGAKVKKKCPRCGNLCEHKANFCPFCGMVFQGSQYGNFAQNPFEGTMFDPLGGVPANEDIGGITASEASKFVRVNTRRYIPLFNRINKSKKKTAWNWAAFLFTYSWLFYRKCYKKAFLIFAISIVPSILSLPLTIYTTQQVHQTDITVTLNNQIIILAIIAMVINLVIRFICGILGDNMYKGFVTQKVKSIKQVYSDPSEIEKALFISGGINLMIGVLSFMFMDYAVQILLTFSGFYS